ncbi:hypothetical protein CBR_g4104 [Chara braunii]|uniref:Secreted protein n=1 Tax=Chara braunii TaxID=69332 RepID=A0A388KH89_CHABU|nr:hypothetical protein CBR_g4104 [Chara braunii]|eukprot:GBG69409.1 hypothetical protein CBR_g4104 [Chara braunii]
MMTVMMMLMLMMMMKQVSSSMICPLCLLPAVIASLKAAATSEDTAAAPPFAAAAAFYAAFSTAFLAVTSCSMGIISPPFSSPRGCNIFLWATFPLAWYRPPCCRLLPRCCLPSIQASCAYLSCPECTLRLCHIISHCRVLALGACSPPQNVLPMPPWRTAELPLPGATASVRNAFLAQPPLCQMRVAFDLHLRVCNLLHHIVHPIPGVVLGSLYPLNIPVLCLHLPFLIGHVLKPRDGNIVLASPVLLHPRQVKVKNSDCCK